MNSNNNNYQEDYDQNYNEDYYQGGEGYDYNYQVQLMIVFNLKDPNVIEWSTAIYSYVAQGEGELTFNENDQIGILEDFGDGWARGTLNGTEGVFPLSYVSKYSDYQQEQGNYSEPTESSNTSQDIRKEKRDKMKSEYKSLKVELETHTTNRDKLEKEIKELTEKSQKLKKELRHMKGNLCDKKSILSDLIKISISMDSHADSIPELPSITEETNEAISQYTGEVQKESKSNKDIAPHAQKIIPKLKEYKDQLEQYMIHLGEAARAGKEFRPDLEALIKVLEKTK